MTILLTATDLPAALGGTPAFDEKLPLVRPALGRTRRLVRRQEQILRSGILTNGPTVRELEETVAARLGVPHVVAVSSCTSGLMLVLQALGATRPGGPARASPSPRAPTPSPGREAPRSSPRSPRTR